MMSSIVAASMPWRCIMYRMTPGSIAPQRVPIMRPSTAVNPMVCRDATAVFHRAKACAIAQVSEDDPPACKLRR